MRKTLPHTVLFALGIVGACAVAQAAEIERGELVLATASCQSALPVFDGVIRKRPLAVQNEGTTMSFLTCALQGLLYAEPHNSTVALLLVNTGEATASVTCTLVDGGPGMVGTVYLPRTVEVPAGATNHNVVWTAAENGDEAYSYPAVSCGLPPGTGISGVARIYNEEIGS